VNSLPHIILDENGLPIFLLFNKKDFMEGNTKYSFCNTSTIKGSGHRDNGGRATTCKADKLNEKI